MTASAGRTTHLVVPAHRAANNWAVEIAAPPGDVEPARTPTACWPRARSPSAVTAPCSPQRDAGRLRGRRARRSTFNGRPPTVPHPAPSRSTSARSAASTASASSPARPTSPSSTRTGPRSACSLGEHRRRGLRHRLVHQRRGSPALPAARGDLRQSGGARSALGQCLCVDGRVGRVQPARGRDRRRRRGRTLGTGGRERRHR